MKKQLFLLLAGGIMVLSACETNVNNNQLSDEQIDSMVNARVEEYRIELMRSNDSMINALAILRADSIIAGMKGGKSVTTTTTRTTSVSNTPKTPNPGSTTTRPGATNTGGTQTTDRPGATNNSNDNTPKPTTDRPGATNSNR